jgi:hypothetical protein
VVQFPTIADANSLVLSDLLDAALDGILLLDSPWRLRESDGQCAEQFADAFLDYADRCPKRLCLVIVTTTDLPNDGVSRVFNALKGKISVISMELAALKSETLIAILEERLRAKEIELDRSLKPPLERTVNQLARAHQFANAKTIEVFASKLSEHTASRRDTKVSREDLDAVRGELI